MVQKTSTVILAVAVALALLGLAVVSLGVVYVSLDLGDTVDQLEQKQADLTNRVQDLEEISDYYLTEKLDEEAEAQTDTRRSPPPEIPELCHHRPEPGPCKGSFSRWHFNPALMDCSPFNWTGCRGNANNFLTQSQCRLTCRVSLVRTPPPEFNANACDLPPDAGPCRYNLQRYYHADGKCLPFSYGGCAGNENSFFSEKDCGERCLRRSRPPSTPCSLPPDPGTCSEKLRRFYYNNVTGRCEAFFFSGCGGNDNNYAKLSKCEKRCTSQA